MLHRAPQFARSGRRPHRGQMVAALMVADLLAAGVGCQPKPETQPEATKRAVAAEPSSAELAFSEVFALERQLRSYVQGAVNEDGFPWVLSHGLLAFGPALRTDKNRLAIDAILEHAQTSSAGSVQFPAATPSGLAVETHRSMIALSLAESGLHSERRLLTLDGHTVTVSDLAQTAIEDVRAWIKNPHSPDQWADFAWTASLYFRFAGSDETSSELARQLMAQLELAHRFLEPLFAQQRPDLLQKRRQGIYRHSCGGFHFVQATFRGAAMVPELRARAHHQAQLLKFRWQAERMIYNNALAQHPDHALALLAQKLRFHGHLLETWSLAARWGVVSPDAENLRFYLAVAKDIQETIDALRQVFARKHALRPSHPKLYNDLMGDASHAIHGLAIGRKYFLGREPRTLPK